MIEFILGFIFALFVVFCFCLNFRNKFKVGDKIQRYSNEFSKNYSTVKEVGSQHYLLEVPAYYHGERIEEQQISIITVDSDFFKVKLDK